MTTTNAWLEANGQSRLAMSLVFDGIDLVYTTCSSPSEIATSFVPTGQWTTVKSGLTIAGAISQECEAFKPRITTDAMSFTIVDADGTLRPLLFGSRSSANVTYLREDLEPSDTAISAMSTAAFGSSGDVYIGHEAIEYSAKVGAPDPGFTSSQRGKYSLFGASGSDYFARRHAGTLRRSDGPGTGTSPEIRSEPDTWYNRLVCLILQHQEPMGSGPWSTVDLPLSTCNSKVLWVGRIKEWQDLGDGSIRIDCIGANDLLMGNVFSRQFRGTLAAGSYLGPDASPVTLKFYDPDLGALPKYDLTGEIFGTWSTGFYDFHELISGIQEQFSTWSADSSIQRSGSVPYHQWSIELQTNGPNGPRVVIECKSTVSTDLNGAAEIGLSPKVWDMLGFGPGDPSSSDKYPIWTRKIPRKSGSATRFILEAPNAPRHYRNPASLTPGDSIVVEGEDGEWIDQPDGPAELASNEATGYLKVGDHLFGVKKYNAAIGAAGYTVFRVTFVINQDDQNSSLDGARTLELGADAPDVRQVWCQRGEAGKLLLSIMLSTGDPGYNEATYDVYPPGFGLGIPYHLVDVASFESLDVSYELMLDKPVPMRTLLEEVLGCFNRHLVLRNGQLSLTRPGFDTTSAEDIVTLDESSKAEPRDRPTVTYSQSGIINHLVLFYTTLRTARQRGWSTVERSEHYVAVEDQVSISRYGSRRTLEIKARGVLDPDAWKDYVATPIIRYFANPPAIITRTISLYRCNLLPGDVVSLTDANVIDPATGLRGVSGVAAWVKSVSMDYGSGRGQVELYYLPSHPARYAKLAPSAMVTSYNAGTKTVTCSAHAFSRTTDDVDVSFFTAGDKVQFVEFSPDPVASPDVLQDEIASVNSGANTVTLVTGVTFAGGLTYVMEPREVASASIPTTSQRNAYAFLASESDHLIDSTYSGKTWSGPTKSLDSYVTTGINYTQEYVRPADKDSDADEPLSSRKIITAYNNANVLLAYVTRNSAGWQMNVSSTSTSYVLLSSPIWLPMNGVDPNSAFTRILSGKVLIQRTSGTITVRVSSNATPPTGVSSSVYSLGPLTFSAEESRSSAGQGWEDFTLNPALTKLNGQVGTWITVEIKHSSGGAGSVRGLSLVEQALT